MIPMKTKVITKYLIVIILLGCLISGCDRSDTEPDLARGCFEAAPTTIINEKLNFVAIPDSVFEWHLVKQGLDADGKVNGRVSMEDVKSIKQFSTNNGDGAFYINPKYSVRSLRGIEYFSNLQSYGSTQDLLDSMDFSHNMNLKRLFFSTDIAGAVMGVPLDLRLSVRTIKYINLGNNMNLRELRIINSSIKEIDVSGLPNLETLEFAGDSLKIIYIRDRNQIRPNWKISFSQSVDGPNDIFQYKVCNSSK
jgi:hypothetical protein